MKNSSRQREGFALMAALWLVVLVGVTGYELSVRSRSQRLAVANALEMTQATASAEAGLETARAQLEMRLAHPLEDRTRAADDARLDPLGELAFIRSDSTALGNERFAVTAYDASARLQLNSASEDDIRRLLQALSVDAADAGRLAQRILDWRDADDFKRANGAERADYLRDGARVLPSNTEFQSVAELRNVDGMTDSLLRRLLPFVALHGSGLVNANTASREVLLSLPGITNDMIAIVISARSEKRALRSMNDLLRNASPEARAAQLRDLAELNNRLIFDTREVVVESTGWVAGSNVRSHALVYYQRSGDAVLTSARSVER